MTDVTVPWLGNLFMAFENGAFVRLSVPLKWNPIEDVVMSIDVALMRSLREDA